MQIGSNPVVNFSHDDNGNLIDDGSLTYSYDRANRLTTVNNGSYNTHFAYDGDGDRYKQTVGGVVTDYVLDMQPGLSVVLQASTTTETLHYQHSPMGVFAVDDGTDWHWITEDGLGTVRGQSDLNTDMTATQSYDPYGLNFEANGTFVGDFGFAGEQIDSNGLSYNRARTYNPMLGTFTALDPFEGYHDEPMSLNGYSYVHGNPINAVDPTGYCEWPTNWDNPIDYRCRQVAEIIADRLDVPLENVIHTPHMELEYVYSVMGLNNAAIGASAISGFTIDVIETAQTGLSQAASSATPEDRRQAFESMWTWFMEDGIASVFDGADLIFALEAIACGDADLADIAALLPLLSRSVTRSGIFPTARRTDAEGYVDLSQPRTWFAYNKPPFRRLTIDEGHILSGHREGGSRAIGNNKDLFPEHWRDEEIFAAIRQAYTTGRRVQTQGERIRVVGNARGLTIEMWVNLETLIMETAYPVGRGRG